MKWLREKMMVNMRKVRTIEEMVREFETDLSCRMVTASRSQEGLVVIVEDGTCCWMVSTGPKTPAHRMRLGTTSTS